MRKRNPRPQGPAPLVLEELEARILLSADGLTGALDDATALAAAHEMVWSPEPMVPAADDASADAPGEAQRVEIVFIDSRVENIDALLEDLAVDAQDGTEFEVVLIQRDRDGLLQVGEALRGRTDIAAIHLLSHGAEGMLLFGSQVLDADAVSRGESGVAEWRAGLAEDADILLYGCDVGAGDAGQSLLQSLATASDADVAASTDDTGQPGDWVLEAATGAIESRTLFSGSFDLRWQGSLATYIVTSTSDSGAGSLRQAIADANANPGTDLITFNIVGTGLHTINLLSALTITDTVSIDATTDNSFAAQGNRPAIILNGGGTVTDGLLLSGAGSGGSTIRGFVLQNFTNAGINLFGSNGNLIVGNWSGLSSAGTAAAANLYGVALWNSSNNIIGGSTAADRNVLSGNTSVGVGISTDNGTSTGNVVRGNYIGTNAAGTAAVGNAAQGIWIDAASNTIGGTGAEGNVISGTTSWVGVQLTNKASGTVISGNLIGTNAAGTAALANFGGGLYIESANNTVGGVTAGTRNIISGNAGTGIVLNSASATGNVVIGNYIGTDASGSVDLNGSAHTNGQSGVIIGNGASNNRIGTNADGANDAAERNVISGNNWWGVEMTGAGTTGNVVQGNYIGTDASGLVALGNSEGGADFWNQASGNRVGGGATGAGNVISGNGTGVMFGLGASNNTLQGNLIGLGADGSTAVGNAGAGVILYDGGGALTLTGNLVGTDGNGVNDAAERNVISANYGGVALTTALVTGNHVAGNLIGTDASGALARGNTDYGVAFAGGASGNTLGGLQAVQSNLVANNGGYGVVVTDGGANNALLGNRILSNGGLGIDLLGVAGVTANDTGDADTGSNDLQNYPVLTTAIVAAGSTTLSGTINSTANTTLRLEFFSSPAADASGHGEGATFLGAASVTTDAGGNASFSVTLLGIAVTSGHAVSATATEDLGGGSYGSTSEFSASVTAAPLQLPTHTAPASASTPEDTALVFSTANGNAIVVNDPDAAGAAMETTLSVTNGNLTLAGTAGLTFLAGDGTLDATISVRGTAAAINAVLDGLQFVPTANYNGSASLVVTTRDSLQVSLEQGTSLVGRYDFNGNATDTGPGTAQSGTLLGNAGFVNDAQRGQVLTLDGDGDAVSIAGVFGSPANVTIGGWVDLSALSSGRADFISLDDRVHIALDDIAGVKGSIQTGVGAWQDLPSNQFIAGTGWHHVMYVFDDARDTHALYIDGQLVASSTITSSIYWAGATTTYIGRHPTATPALDFQGQVDDVRLFDRALSAAEVATLASATPLQSSATVPLTVTAVNDAPVLSLISGHYAYPEGAGAVVLGASATITDIDSPDFDGGTLNISFTANGQPEDRLGIRNEGNGAGQIGIAGSVLSYGGVTVGSFTGGTDGSTPLVVTFNASANAAAVQAVIRNVTYQNVSDAPSAAVRTLAAYITDGDGGTSNQVSGTLSITPANDAPVLDTSAPMTFTGINENDLTNAGQTVASVIASAGGDRITDPDGTALEGIAVTSRSIGGGTWQYSTDGGANWREVGGVSSTSALLLRDTDRLRFVPDGTAGTTASLSFRAWDRTSGSTGQYASTSSNGGTTAFSTATATATLAVSAANDAPTFNIGTGLQSLALPGLQYGNALAMQADGKYLVAGWSDAAGTRDFIVARFHANGGLDTTFGAGNGYVVTALGASDDEAQDIQVQTDGKIVVAGYALRSGTFDISLVRYNADGTLDTSFGAGTGIAATSLGSWDTGYRMMIQADGRILVAGDAGNDMALARFNADGSLDTAFGTGGVVTTDIAAGADVARGLVVQADGRIIIAGQAFSGTSYDLAIVRYSANGTLDTSLNGTGKVLVDMGSSSGDFGYGLAVATDGRILVSGFTDAAGTADIALVRLTSSGALDTSFNGTGRRTVAIGSASDFGLDVQLQPDGRILVGGYSNIAGNDFTLLRFNTDGSFDTGFGTGGVVTTNFGGFSDDRGTRLLVQADGRIVLAGSASLSGSADLALVRYNANGTLDVTFNGVGTLGGTVAWTEGATPMVLDADARALDAELTALDNFSGATLSLARTGGAQAEDVLGFTGTQVTASGGNVLVSGVQVGTFVAAGGQLDITFGANATNTRVNTVLRNIVYSNTNNAPPASVQITWTLSDGNTGAQGTGGALTASGTTTVNITAVNDTPTTSPVVLTPIAEDSGARLITQVELLANATDVDGDALTATGLAISAGNGALVNNGNGTWSYTPAANDASSVTFSYTIADGNGGSVSGSATLDLTPVNDAPTTTPVVLAPIAEDSGARLITQVELLGNAADVDGDALTATGLAVSAGNGALVNNGNGTWSYTPAANDASSVTFSYTISDGNGGSVSGSATLDLTPVNDAPTTTPVVLAPIAEDSGARLITQAELLTNAADLDGDALTATGLAIASGTGTLADNGNGTWSYTPATNDNTAVTFSYSIADGNGGGVAGSATLDLTPVNDAPTTNPVVLAPIAEDSGARLITQAELLANAADVDGDVLTAASLSISSGNGALVDNGNGTWSYTPTANDTSSVAFSYTIADGNGGSVSGSATLDLTPANDAPTTTPVVLAPIAEDSGARLITQAELLTNAADVDGDALTASSLTIASGNGTLVDNGDGTWSYTPAINDNTAVTFGYTIGDGSGGSIGGSANLDLTPVNDAPTTTPVVLAPIAEDSGARLITQVELLANATDVDGDALTATSLSISSGNGSLVDNGNGTWSYIPAANDTSSAAFSYTIADGNGGSVSGSATLDITPANDAPTTTPVILAPIAEDSGARLITQAELLANAADLDGDALTAATLAIASGNGTLVDNGNGTWSYSPATNDASSVAFSYTISDGNGGSVTGSASLDLTPVNDAPTTTPVVLAPIAEDSGARLITQAELLANAVDLDGDSLTATGLAIASGTGTLVDNGNGTWSYIPAANDSSAVTFSYSIVDGNGGNAGGNATLDLTPVNDAPTTTPVALAPIAEDSGARLITQVELLANAADVDGDALIATGLSISSGNGTLVDNGDGTWSYSPATNDASSVVVSYTIADGNSGSVAGTATLDLMPVNDAPYLISASGSSTPALVAEGQRAASALRAGEIESDPLSFQIVDGPDAGRFMIDAQTGDLSFVTAPDFEQPGDADGNNLYEVVLAASDGQGGVLLQPVQVLVTGVNEAPTAAADALQLAGSASMPITQTVLLQNDKDIDGDTLRVVDFTPPQFGTLVQDAVGDWSYLPATGFAGIDQFTYTVADAAGLRATAEVTIQVATDTSAAPAPSTPPTTTSPPTSASASTAGEPIARVAASSAASSADSTAESSNSSVPQPAAESRAGAAGGSTGSADANLPVLMDTTLEGTIAPDSAPTDSVQRDAGPSAYYEERLADKLLSARDVEAAPDWAPKFATDVAILNPQGQLVLGGLRLLAGADGVSDLRRSMEQLGDSLGEALTEADASRLEVARIVVGSGVSLSVGIVAWLLRGGALAGSLLSMLPAWSSFDPIPILHQRRRNGPQAANVPSDATEQALSRILRPGVPPSAQV